jgi:hypothetical protein
MVGTSAIRSPSPRHCATAFLNAGILRTMRGRWFGREKFLFMAWLAKHTSCAF